MSKDKTRQLHIVFAAVVSIITSLICHFGFGIDVLFSHGPVFWIVDAILCASFSWFFMAAYLNAGDPEREWTGGMMVLSWFVSCIWVFSFNFHHQIV